MNGFFNLLNHAMWFFRGKRGEHVGLAGQNGIGSGSGILSATLIFCISKTADENVEIKLQEKEYGRLDCGYLS